jgi:hypothetical protein
MLAVPVSRRHTPAGAQNHRPTLQAAPLGGFRVALV